MKDPLIAAGNILRYAARGEIILRNFESDPEEKNPETVRCTSALPEKTAKIVRFLLTGAVACCVIEEPRKKPSEKNCLKNISLRGPD